jgi:Tol biopolymer transport system component
MTWFDRAGNPLSSFGSEGLYQFLALSPDQLRLAADAQDSQAGYELFVVDLPRGTVTQLTFGADTGNFPVWSPDGTRIAYASSRDGVYNLYIKSSGGTSSEEVLLKNDRNKFLMDWSPDGKYLLFGERDPNTKSSDLWLLPMAGDRKPVLFLRGDADKREGRFSPDGHWVAYSSDESNRMQVYVQSFAAPSQRWQISTDGGSRPRWRDDGRELFYMEPEGRLMAVAVRDGTSFEAGKPAPLFNTNIANRLVTFDVAKGGQRFVMPVVDRNAPAGSVTVIVNFTAGVKK